MVFFPVRHGGLKLLSIVVATLLWLVVTGDPVVERNIRVGLELQRAPAGIELVGAVPETVAVRVRGAASRLSALGPGNLSVVVDLDGVKSGRRLFPLTADQVTVPYGVEVAQVTPSALPLTFEATVGKVVPVRPRIEGTPVPGHSVTNVSVNPSQVRIEGPESSVNGLAEVVTEPVSVERATSLVRAAVTLDVSDADVRLSGGGTAVVT
ncbi:MAG TPA: CdaR family protein, partial [Vicinamibacterales bacterium]|nr:CdaR family protein [Vicinamibacterales bacterium]